MTDDDHLPSGVRVENVVPLFDRNDAPEHSEEAIALTYAEKHADTLRYVAQWGKWFIWDGCVWREDHKRVVFSLSRIECRAVAMTVNKPQTRKQLASAKTRAAVVSLVSDDQRLAASIDQWDADDWLLNTPKGVVDLRTGKMQPHRATDYMTKMTAVAPEGECPRWRMFLNEITQDDEELQKFLQRISGYCLTGITSEQALFFLYGLGGNGKGRFVHAISGILNDYHVNAAIETFVVTKVERHPTELAKLCGARLVTSTETEEGRPWAEARIKELTGQDPIDARFMRQDFFTYYPKFKLMFMGNHMPTLRTVNKAISRRFNRIPFNFAVPDEQKNANLDNELKEEWPGILKWMVEGCLEWQRLGLCPPKVVTAATEQYLESQDVLGEWIDDCCERDVNAFASSTELYNSWKAFAESRGERFGTSKMFSMRLDDRGFKKEKTSKANGFYGLVIRDPADDKFTSPGVDMPF